MRSLLLSTLIATGLSAPLALGGSPFTVDLDLAGSSPSISGSLAALEIDLSSQRINWSSTDSLLGTINTSVVSPQVWNQSADRLTFRYTDSFGRAFVGNLLLGDPDRTVVDVVSGSIRARYLFKLNPGRFPAASITDVTVNEEGGVANVTMTLDSEPLQPGSVDFTTTIGTASALDFDHSPGTVTFAAGQRVATISIPIVNDLRVERVENFTVNLVGATRATIDNGTCTVTIEDVDTTVVNFFDAKVEEPFAPDAWIPVRLSAPSDFPIMLVHSTPEGTATRLIDFLPRTNTITFTPGQLEFMVYISIADDADPEGDEQFAVRLNELLLGERTTVGRDRATVTILDNDDNFKAPQVDEIGWQWPNGADFRPELTYDQYLMTEGTLALAQNFGHGTPGTTTTVSGIPFTNTGVGGVNVVGFNGGINWSVAASGGTTSDAGGDDLFFSQIEGPNPVRLEVDGLDPAKRYVVQLLFGESGDIDARNWTIDTDLGFTGNVGGPLRDYIRRQFGQGPIGGGVPGQPNAGRRIVTLGLCARTGFFFENQGWDNKAPSLSGFQIREVAPYPLPPDAITLQSIRELHWTGSQIVAGTAKGEIFTSPNTVEWTPQVSNFIEDINNIATVFGGTLLATTRFGEFLTSTDNGVTWASQDPANVGRINFTSITDIGGTLVIAGDDGNLVSTTDLLNWTPLVSNTAEPLSGAAWNGSVLVIVGNRGTVLNSSDGVTFTAFQVPGANNINLNSLIWDGSQFVCAGRVRGSVGGGVLFTSPDGATWTQSAFTARDPLNNLRYTGSLYIMGSRNGSIYTSPDAVTWTEQLPVPNDGIQSIIWTGERFVVGCQNGDFMWSFDGVTWSSETGVPTPPPAFAGNTFGSWAAQYGRQPADLASDLNRDGFPDLFNYAIGVSPDKLLPRELPGLLPSVDTRYVADRATTVFHLPEFLPADLRLEIEKSTDGRNWSVIASRTGTGAWDTTPQHILIQDDPVGGYQTTRLPAAGTYAEEPLALFRLRVSLAN